jgi:hypothetical protein
VPLIENLPLAALNARRVMPGVRQLSYRVKLVIRVMRSFPFVGLLSVSLLFGLLPADALCSPHDKPHSRPSQVVFEMSIRYWGMYSGKGCRQTIIIQLYSDGQAVSEACRKKSLDSTKLSYHVVRKETNLQEKDVAAFMRLVEASDFPKAQGRLHTGLNLADTGYTITLIYYVNEGERKLEVVNYDPDSKLLPAWLHKIVETAAEFIPKEE